MIMNCITCSTVNLNVLFGQSLHPKSPAVRVIG